MLVGHLMQASIVVVWRRPRARRLSQHRRVALAPWRRRPARKLALHDLRDHADKPSSHGYAAGGSHD